MDGEAVTDLILRAIAAMRERGDIPPMDAPQITVRRITGASTCAYHANIGQALAASQTTQDSLPPEALGASVATYLAEVADLVPAYHDVAAIELVEGGAILITLTGETHEHLS
jgi:hypothetical protein